MWSRGSAHGHGPPHGIGRESGRAAVEAHDETPFTGDSVWPGTMEEIAAGMWS
ncbi:hypothetical protein [Streptomyces minutiscleroticus]|uniref:hypothetical protein n=1 Tax=Streptomyces minutiscleroticus TaxID=68238 RepID=UPI00333342EF